MYALFVVQVVRNMIKLATEALSALRDLDQWLAGGHHRRSQKPRPGLRRV